MEIQQIDNQLSTLSDERITAEILIYKDQVGYGMIELGKRLIEMKKRLGHGKFLEYLAKEVEFSERTAQNFMKIAKEFPNTKTFSHLNLGVSKIYAILGVAEPDREDFINTPHPVETKNGIVEKTVGQMTVREVEQVIKLEKELAEKDKLLQQEKETQSLLNRRINNINNDLMETQKAKDKYLTELNEKDKQIRKLKNEVKTEIVYEESPELQKALWEAEQKANELNERLAEAEEELEKLSKIKEAGFEIVEMKKNIDNLKAEYTNIQLESNNNQIIFDTIKKLRNFVATEITPLGTLIIPYNTAPTIQIEINNIIKVLEDLIYSVKIKFKIN